MFCLKYKRAIDTRLYYEMHPHLIDNSPIRSSDIVLHCRDLETAEKILEDIYRTAPPYVKVENAEIYELPPLTIKRRGGVILSAPPLARVTTQEIFNEQKDDSREPETPDSPDFSNRVKPKP